MILPEEVSQFLQHSKDSPAIMDWLLKVEDRSPYSVTPVSQSWPSFEHLVPRNSYKGKSPCPITILVLCTTRNASDVAVLVVCYELNQSHR